MANTPSYHARTHKPGGTDPIEGLNAGYGPWITPTLLNDWANFDDDCPFQYRWAWSGADTVDDSGLEFRGKITGGTTGSTVFTLPSEDLFDCDKDELAAGLDVDSTPIVTFFHIDSSTGNFIVTYPI